MASKPKKIIPDLPLAERQERAVPCALSPKLVTLRADTEYKWCTCGHSKTQPFCDHAHRELAPGMKSLRIRVPADGKYLMCMCKQTASPLGLCDNSHLLPRTLRKFEQTHPVTKIGALLGRILRLKPR